ncbi:MAG TPA: hypothetical protein VH597_17955 [Verrucomicrobiae bacterium]|jgi:hypothetical protein|nr:hypothetical protein [Verrucomicrobiae bacterium]
MKTSNKRVKLDWSRLIGFNQVRSQQSEKAKKMLAAKIGGKGGGAGA